MPQVDLEVHFEMYPLTHPLRLCGVARARAVVTPRTRLGYMLLLFQGLRLGEDGRAHVALVRSMTAADVARCLQARADVRVRVAAGARHHVA